MSNSLKFFIQQILSVNKLTKLLIALLYYTVLIIIFNCENLLKSTANKQCKQLFTSKSSYSSFIFIDKHIIFFLILIKNNNLLAILILNKIIKED